LNPTYWVVALPVSAVGAIGYWLTPIQTEPVSWQLAQPLVTPAWTCVVVGAGVMNLVPGAVVVAFAAMSPLGMAAWWHDSQAVPDGMCAAGPDGDVGGITMILVMPAKPVTVGPWQVTQPVRPAWFIAEFANFAPLTTGVAAMLEPAPTWQVSQEAVVGTWFDGSPTIEKFAAGIANEAAALPWHWSQLAVVLGA
jgi:hypothetical protein